LKKAQLAPLSEKEINPAGRQQKVQIFELARLSELGSRQWTSVKAREAGNNKNKCQTLKNSAQSRDADLDPLGFWIGLLS